MRPVKRSSTKRYWVHMMQLPLFVAGLGAMLAYKAVWISLPVALAVFAATVALSILVSNWAMRSFTCPDCGAKLRPPKGWWHAYAGKPILFYCAACDTDWHFGLTGGQD